MMHLYNCVDLLCCFDFGDYVVMFALASICLLAFRLWWVLVWFGSLG